MGDGLVVMRACLDVFGDQWTCEVCEWRWRCERDTRVCVCVGVSARGILGV